MSYLATCSSFLQPCKGKSPKQSRFAAGLATRLLCIPVNFQVQAQFALLCCQAKRTSQPPSFHCWDSGKADRTWKKQQLQRQAQGHSKVSGSVMQMRVTKSCTVRPHSHFQSKSEACFWGLRWRGKYGYRFKSPGLVWFIWQSSQSILSTLDVMTLFVLACGSFLGSHYFILRGVSSLFSPVHDWHEQEGNVETIETVLCAGGRCLIFFWTWPRCLLLHPQAHSLPHTGRTRASSPRFRQQSPSESKGLAPFPLESAGVSLLIWLGQESGP